MLRLPKTERKRWLNDSLQQHKDDLTIDQVGGIDDCLPIVELQGWTVTPMMLLINPVAASSQIGLATG